ncbi:hypothetical protein WN48_09002 [Eufriesea mexicana]|uniref:Uncharacterized protein n=1 Tax=Eufriesea mexicana TaxID=516756 RepID=A0A310SRL7_9HYME|nr:hypothetical protein WN48_09002 [Eufriesea mexicana]
MSAVLMSPLTSPGRTGTGDGRSDPSRILAQDARWDCGCHLYHELIVRCIGQNKRVFRDGPESFGIWSPGSLDWLGFVRFLKFLRIALCIFVDYLVTGLALVRVASNNFWGACVGLSFY